MKRMWEQFRRKVLVWLNLSTSEQTTAIVPQTMKDPVFSQTMVRKTEHPLTVPQPGREMALAEQARKLIIMLLDLPITKEQPELVCDFITHLARAAMRGDEEVLKRLQMSIYEARRRKIADFTPANAIPRSTESVPDNSISQISVSSISATNYKILN